MILSIIYCDSFFFSEIIINYKNEDFKKNLGEKRCLLHWFTDLCCKIVTVNFRDIKLRGHLS